MVNLAPYNTLKVSARTQSFLEINTPEDLKKLNFTQPYMFLGQGANILFTKDFPGTIAKVNLKGCRVVSETDSEVIIEVAAGENWHDLVTWTVENNWSGMENMALIPGTAGAAVVGNIAAYGGNQEDLFVNLQATNLKSQKPEEFSKPDCQFSYRDSFFKKNHDHLITSVTYRLSKVPHFETSYRATRHASLLPTLQQIAKKPYSLRDFYNAVVKMRTEKLPGREIGTAGSFFKNPIITKKKYQEMSQRIPDLLAYPIAKLQYTDPSDKEKYVKLSLGRVLDELGWKGKTIGRVSTSPSHAMYVINLGGATGVEIYEYAEAMRTDVKNHFDLPLEYEIVIV